MQAAPIALVVSLALALVAGCGSSSGGTASVGGTGGSSSVQGAQCELTVTEYPIEGANHVPACSPVVYGTNPPSSGNHYPIWAAYRQYPDAIPRGFWVHDLEHGGVVVTYNCPDGCADDVAAITAWAATVPEDHACTGQPVSHRLVITPDPLLDVKFAASAWGVTLRAPCFDAAAFTDFFAQHVGHGPEIICSDGEDLTVTVPMAGCGQ